jgi:rhamnogalacturonyl hydrolase YesR
MRSHAAVANLCFERFKQTNLRPYHDLVVKRARWYLDNDPNVSSVGMPNVLMRALEWVIGAEPPVYPRMMGQAIKLMLNAYELTGDQKYLARADHFAQWSIRTFVDDSPLPWVSHRNDHYEAVTGGDALMMAILELWTVKADRMEEVRWFGWTDKAERESGRNFCQFSRLNRSECKVQSSECKVQSAKFRVQSSECKVQSAKFRMRDRSAF